MSGELTHFDDAGAIGRRYRRHDEIGTPFCVTIDTDTLKDDTVTIHIVGFARIVGDLLTAEVNNLSLRGCHVSTFDPLPADGRYHLTLFVEDDERALHFRVEARIVRSDGEPLTEAEYEEIARIEDALRGY